MNEFFNKIKFSFNAAMKGEETIQNLVWRWGFVAYLFSYFALNNFIKYNNFRALDILASMLAVIYFIWHIYVLRKCTPKKPQLSPEEKKKIRQKNRQELPKKFLRKLLLQEPITNWDPPFIAKIIDLFCIAIFLGYVFN